jgi:hypothetical protein
MSAFFLGEQILAKKSLSAWHLKYIEAFAGV